MTTDVQRWCAFRQPDRPAKGYLSHSPLEVLTPQERQMRAVLRSLQENRWQLRKATTDARRLMYAKRLARAFQRWKALYDNWEVGPSGYKPMRINLMGWKPKPQHWDPPPIEGEFSDPLAP